MVGEQRMREFFEAQVKSVEVRGDLPAPEAADCLRVGRVAPLSLAAHLGIAEGDLLVAVDGKPTSRRHTALHRFFTAERRYTLFSPESGVTRELHLTGAELGVELERTVEALRAGRDPLPGELEQLWRLGEWSLLEDLSRAMLVKGRNHPALAFLGAALQETGRNKEGEALTLEYQRDSLERWTTNFAAVALYYNGRAELQRGARQAGLALLRQAYQAAPIERIADALEEATGERPQPPVPRWKGQRFPIDYRLKVLDTKSGLGLASALARLPPHRVLLVCVLENYRGNGPYDDFMARYRVIASYFHPFVHGLHVLTSTPLRPREYPQFFLSEDAVQKDGLPMVLLEDAGAAVALALEIPGSPRIFAVDRERRVLYEGELSFLDFHALIANLPEPPPGALTAPREERKSPLEPFGVTAARAPAPDAGASAGRSWLWIGLGLLMTVVALGGIGYYLKRPWFHPPDSRPRINVMIPSAEGQLRALPSVMVPLSVRSGRSVESLRPGHAQLPGSAAELKPAYRYEWTSAVGPGGRSNWMVAYSSEAKLPPGVDYMLMSVPQFLQEVERDQACTGLTLDPGHEATYLQHPEVARLLRELPPVPALPVELRSIPRK